MPSKIMSGGVKASLPQRAADPVARRAGLDLKQARYKFDYRPKFVQDEPDLEDVLFPCTTAVPTEESFSTGYMAERFVKTAPMFSNNLLMKARKPFDPLDALEDYDDVYIRLDKPEQVVELVYDDNMFAEQRLAGVNPLRIAALDPADPRGDILKGITDDELQKFALQRLADKQVFVTDYTGKDPTYTSCLNAQDGTAEFDGEVIQKYLPKPIAFFYWDVPNSRLMPLAIQVSEGGRVFTPKDGEDQDTGVLRGILGFGQEQRDDWLFAKLAVGVADANHHEMVAHLALHFIFEPIAISTQRQLHESHPVNLLLRTHMRFFMANNNIAHDTLVAKGGTVDQVMAARRVDMLGICVDAIRKWDMKKSSFVEDVKSRGLDDPAVLPKYAYRDDGMKVWQVIYDTVSDYLGCFYESDQAVKDDYELQAWAAELSATPAEGGGWVGGFPSKFETLEEVVDIVAITIMHVGPVHAAVNYLQYPYMSLVTNMPMAAYADPEEMAKKDKITRKDLLSFLPPFQLLSVQVDTVFFLCAYKYDELGEYEKSYKDLYDSNLDDVFSEQEAAAKVLKDFKPKLDAVEEEIKAANAKRKIKYFGMLPSEITNSTSI